MEKGRNMKFFNFKTIAMALFLCVMALSNAWAGCLTAKGKFIDWHYPSYTRMLSELTFSTSTGDFCFKDNSPYKNIDTKHRYRFEIYGHKDGYHPLLKVSPLCLIGGPVRYDPDYYSYGEDDDESIDKFVVEKVGKADGQICFNLNGYAYGALEKGYTGIFISGYQFYYYNASSKKEIDYYDGIAEAFYYESGDGPYHLGLVNRAIVNNTTVEKVSEALVTNVVAVVHEPLSSAGDIVSSKSHDLYMAALFQGTENIRLTADVKSIAAYFGEFQVSGDGSNWFTLEGQSGAKYSATKGKVRTHEYNVDVDNFPKNIYSNGLDLTNSKLYFRYVATPSNGIKNLDEANVPILVHYGYIPSLKYCASSSSSCFTEREFNLLAVDSVVSVRLDYKANDAYAAFGDILYAFQIKTCSKGVCSDWEIKDLCTASLHYTGESENYLGAYKFNAGDFYLDSVAYVRGFILRMNKNGGVIGDTLFTDPITFNMMHNVHFDNSNKGGNIYVVDEKGKRYDLEKDKQILSFGYGKTIKVYAEPMTNFEFDTWNIYQYNEGNVVVNSSELKKNPVGIKINTRGIHIEPEFKWLKNPSDFGEISYAYISKFFEKKSFDEKDTVTHTYTKDNSPTLIDNFVAGDSVSVDFHLVCGSNETDCMYKVLYRVDGGEWHNAYYKFINSQTEKDIHVTLDDDDIKGGRIFDIKVSTYLRHNETDVIEQFVGTIKRKYYFNVHLSDRIDSGEYIYVESALDGLLDAITDINGGYFRYAVYYGDTVKFIPDMNFPNEIEMYDVSDRLELKENEDGTFEVVVKSNVGNLDCSKVVNWDTLNVFVKSTPLYAGTMDLSLTSEGMMQFLKDTTYVLKKGDQIIAVDKLDSALAPGEYNLVAYLSAVNEDILGYTIDYSGNYIANDLVRLNEPTIFFNGDELGYYKGVYWYAEANLAETYVKDDDYEKPFKVIIPITINDTTFNVRFLTYNAAGEDSVVSTQTVKYGEMPTPPEMECPESTEDKKITCGWNLEIKPAVSDFDYMYAITTKSDVYKVKFIVKDSSKGYLEIDNEKLVGEIELYVAKGMTLDVKAVANSGYEFSDWNDDVEKASRTIKVEKDASYIVEFEAVASSSSKGGKIDNPKDDGKSSSSKGRDAIVPVMSIPMFSVTTVARELQIANAQVGSRFAVFDMQGRVMTQGRVESANFNLTMPHAGAYMLCIAGQSHKVALR